MLKNIQYILLAFFVIAASTSCVSKKKFVELEESQAALQMKYDKLTKDLSSCEDDKDNLTSQVENLKAQQQLSDSKYQSDIAAKDDRITKLNEEMEYFKATNTNLLSRLEDLSVINKAGAESIKKSLDNLNQQSKYIQELSSDIQRKDSMNLSLVMNLKRSLSDVNDEDINVDVRDGVVYISISDKLLFQSGSAWVNSEAKKVLEKVATVVNDHKDFDILVEGHTDDKKLVEGAPFIDNWDLSVKRAAAIVRILQDDYEVDPSRLTAGGRSEYAPKADNETAEGRKMNRRTEIIVTPKLDQFFDLMVPAGTN